MRRKLALILLALLVVGLASPVLATPINCPSCGQWEWTTAVYYCEPCGLWFTVEPAQSWNGDVPPDDWDCLYCHAPDVPPRAACCDNPNCVGGQFWP